MIKIKKITRRSLRQTLEHQDARSERHRKDMAYKSCGVAPDPWLSLLRSTLKTFGREKQLTTEELGVQFRLRGKAGRRPDRPLNDLGYQFIYNPGNEVQKKLRALSVVAPEWFVQVHKQFSDSFFKAIQLEFPGALGQLAWHNDSGRWHHEGTLCKLDQEGKVLPWAKGFHYDKAAHSAWYETRLSGDPAKLRVNSRLAVNLRKAYENYFRNQIEPRLCAVGLWDAFTKECETSHRVLLAHSIRREIAFTLSYPNPRSQKVTRSKERYKKWIEEHLELFPGITPPSERDFSFCGIITRAFERADIPPSERKEWITRITYRLVFYFRLHLAKVRPAFDPRLEAMDDVFMENLWQPLGSFQALEFVVERFLVSGEVKPGSINYYSMQSVQLRDLMKRILDVTPSIVFQNSFLEVFDQRLVRTGPVR